MEVVSQGGCRRLFYTTAGEVDGLQDDVGWFQMMKQANGRPSADLNISWSSVEVSLEECRQLWEPWRRALIIKLLRKTVSLKVLESRVHSLWKLMVGCEIIDMYNDFFSVQFFSRQDHLKVLEGEPGLFLDNT